MAIANLLVKIGADIAELKTGTDAAVRQFEKTGQKIDSIGSSIKATLLSAFTVTAVVSFGRELLQMADDIVRTADRTGLLTSEVQKLSYIAGQSGNSLEELTGAIGQLQNRLASGDKSAVAALKAMNVSFDELRKASPYEQFELIAAAVAQIPNPATRAQVAMDLFGKSGIAVLPTLTANVKALGDAAPKMSDNTVRALEQLGDAFNLVKLSIKVWAAESYNTLGRAFDHMIADVYRLIGGFADVTAKLLDLAQKVPGATKVFPDLADKIKKTREEAEWYRDTAKGLTRQTEDVGAAVRKIVPPFDDARKKVVELTDAQKKAKAAAEAHAEALKKGRDALFGTGLISGARSLLEQLGPLSNLTKVSADKQKELNAAMTAAIETYRRHGQVAPQSIRDLFLATQPTIPLVHNYAAALIKAGEAYVPLINSQARLAEIGGGAWPQMIHDANQYLPIVGKVIDASKTLGDTIQSSLIDVLKNVPAVIAQAFTGGGGLVGAMKAVGVMLADAVLTPLVVGLTKLQKAAVSTGSGMAAALGGATGGGTIATIAGIAGSLGGAALAASAWGTSMAAAGMAGTVALGAATLGIGAAAVGIGLLIKKAMSMTEYEKRMRQAAADTFKLQQAAISAAGGMDRLRLQASLVGIQIDEAFKWRDPEALSRVLTEVETKTAALNAAMEEYGFTWQDLGEQARGAMLAELFTVLFEKTQLLKGAGIDYSEILKRQAGDYSDLVQAAIRSGTEIPVAMRPVLDELLEMGLLVDESGQAFKDLSQVTWAKTLTQGFDQVTDAIHELTDMLSQLGKTVVHIPVKFDVEELPGGAEVPGFAGGTHGRLLNFGSGRLAMLHGREGVFTEQDVEQGLLGTGTEGGDIVINHQTILDGKVIDERITRVARKDAARGGLRPRAAHGRSY